MALLFPVSDKPSSGNYHQIVSWKISEEAWNRDEDLFLRLGTDIPGSWHGDGRMRNGGFIHLSRGNPRLIRFKSIWPKEVKEENIHIETIVRMKKGSEVRSVLNVLDYARIVLLHTNAMMMFSNQTALPNPKELDLYDENKVFFLEAEIRILKKNPEVLDAVNAPCEFLRDMKSIMKSEDISDVVIICDGKVIKSHKTILCARSTVFRKMLSGETLENLTREVKITDASVEAVEDMLKYIYTGEITDDLDLLNPELLYLAEKYGLSSLKFACGGSIVSSLTVSNCISSFISVERYFPPDSWVRKRIDVFLRCNAEQVIESEGLDDLVKKVPELLRDLMRAMIKGRKE
eukprot:GFUD01019060.1.p1 GENE.GFUD01019060.1~~GFUD01019060.1.p1  ORF type:complete len:347 (-),score=78.78 GFUD01019060.1:221-1261(-)